MLVSELTGDALDWMVAKCEGVVLEYGLTDDERYSTNWAQGGPIIGRVKIDTAYENDRWFAYESLGDCCDPSVGPTLLIAAMRCYVASKLGEEVEVPDEYT